MDERRTLSILASSVGGVIAMMFLLNAIALDIDTVNKHGAVVGPDRMPWTVTVRQPAIENVLRELKTGYEGAVTFPEGLSMTLKPAVWTTR